MALQKYARTCVAGRGPEPLTKGGPRTGPIGLRRVPRSASDDGPFAVDVLTVPESNPWLPDPALGLRLPRRRPSLAVCTWDGDVWLVGGLDAPRRRLTWRRIASGLFQPLGLKVVDGAIYVCCRDQIVRPPRPERRRRDRLL